MAKETFDDISERLSGALQNLKDLTERYQDAEKEVIGYQARMTTLLNQINAAQHMIVDCHAELIKLSPLESDWRQKIPELDSNRSEYHGANFKVKID